MSDGNVSHDSSGRGAAHKKRRRPGRPTKYDHIIRTLDDGTIFSPAGIARYADDQGLLTAATLEEKRLERQRIRITLARLATNHGFPDEGDGIVRLQGQAPTPGWFGSRWKKCLISL